MSDSSARVAIIGGGAIGTSTLFHLAERHGISDVVLFEKGQLGSGSTSKAAGGVRNTFTNPLNIEQGNRNIEFFKNFSEHVGEDLEFRETGYLYLFHSESEERRWRSRLDLYEEHGVNAEIVSPSRIAEIFPHLDPDALTGGLYAPDCGHVDPHMLTQAFGKAAVDRGATIHTKTAVTDVVVEDESVTAIESEEGRYEVDAVLNAAGPWASKIGDMVGIDIPLELHLRRIMVTDAIEPANSPLIIDPEMECYFETEKNGSLLICDMEQDDHNIGNPDDATGQDIGYEYYLKTFDKVEKLLPGLPDLEVINGWAGIQSHTPDGHAILGACGVDDMYLACGLSGHGVQQSPSIGQAMADVIAEGETEVMDIQRLDLSRFSGDGIEAIEPEGMA